MAKADYQEIIAEYKEQVRVLKEQNNELTDACKVKAEVEILEDGTWHINKILGRYEPAYKKKKSYN